MRDAMIPRGLAHGVIYVAGEAFFVDGGGHNIIRLSFSAPTPRADRRGCARGWRATVREERSPPRRWDRQLAGEVARRADQRATGTASEGPLVGRARR